MDPGALSLLTPTGSERHVIAYGQQIVELESLGGKTGLL